jgi:hypothetical protein
MGRVMESFEYKSHKVEIEVADRGRGWVWTYQVDSGPVIANNGPPHPSEVLARLEAIAVAEREIDGAAGNVS